MRTSPLLLLLLPSLLFADEVYIKGAGTVSGRITEQTDAMVTVDVGGGTIGVPMARVERIVKGRSALDDYDERAGKLGPQDAKGWRDLARWAAKNGLPAQSRAAYETVLDSAPDDAEAREALGFVRLEGRWVTEEESYRARGYVKHDGEWMTRQEAQASAAAEQARRDSERRTIDAEIAKQEAEARAREAEERAREAESSSYNNSPLYWGSWGYGATYWPYATTAPVRPVNRPADRPVRTPR